jgi:hypothetical protein
LSLQLNTIAQELQRRIAAFDLYNVSEYTMKEFMSPLLVGAVVFNAEVNQDDGRK